MRNWNIPRTRCDWLLRIISELLCYSGPSELIMIKNSPRLQNLSICTWQAKSNSGCYLGCIWQPTNKIIKLIYLNKDGVNRYLDTASFTLVTISRTDQNVHNCIDASFSSTRSEVGYQTSIQNVHCLVRDMGSTSHWWWIPKIPKVPSVTWYSVTSTAKPTTTGLPAIYETVCPRQGIR